MSVTRRTRTCDDSGMTMVLVALMLIALMFFASIVVDMGAVYNLRRQDQNAADAAALAAARDLREPVSTMVATAKLYAHDTLDETFTAAEWDSCTGDVEALATQVPGSNCISYNSTQVRVHIPDQFYKTGFGRVLGVDEVRHSAFAVAGLRRAGFGGVLPFAVTGDSAAGGFGCLKSDSNGQTQSYCGSTAGNFGYLDFSLYGSPDLNTTKSCGQGDTGPRISQNIAVGVDHDLSIAGSVHLTPIVDTDGCSANPQTDSPDAAKTQTGNVRDRVTSGMFDNGTGTFSDGLGPRLRRTSSLLFGTGGATTTVLGVSGVDNNPLWRFIPPNYGPNEQTVADIPVSCKRDQFVDSNDNYYSNIMNNGDLEFDIRTFLAPMTQREQILGLTNRCLTHFKGDSWDGFPVGSTLQDEAASGCTGACDDAVFALNSQSESPNLYDIQYTPRFGYVPTITAFPGGQSSSVEFIRFRAVYIQRLFVRGQGSTPDQTFDPGVTPAPQTTGSHQGVGDVAVFVFPDKILPNGLADTGAPFAINRNRFIQLVR